MPGKTFPETNTPGFYLYLLLMVAIFLLAFQSTERTSHAETIPDNQKEGQQKNSRDGHNKDESKESEQEDDSIINKCNAAFYSPTSPPREAVRHLAEWENYNALLLTWDEENRVFIKELIAAVAPVVPVYLLISSTEEGRSIGEYLSEEGVFPKKLIFLILPTDGHWSRDFGPITVMERGNKPAYIDLPYYADRPLNDALPSLLGHHFGVAVYRPELTLEGGNLLNNGKGLCLTSTQIVEDNPDFTERELLQEMRLHFGCRKTVLLNKLIDEETGHVDIFTKFLKPDLILLGYYDHESNPDNAAILDINAQILSQVRLSDGRKLQVVRMPMPPQQGSNFPSYMNSILINGVAVIPTYENAHDSLPLALALYALLLPENYRIVTVNSSKIIKLGGAVHCMAMPFRIPSSAEKTPAGTGASMIDLEQYCY